jgi:hypothetical protein
VKDQPAFMRAMQISRTFLLGIDTGDRIDVVRGLDNGDPARTEATLRAFSLVCVLKLIAVVLITSCDRLLKNIFRFFYHQKNIGEPYEMFIRCANIDVRQVKGMPFQGLE